VKRLVIPALAAVVLCAAAAPAHAATPTDRKIAALQKQVATLQLQVKRLQVALVANFAGDACLATQAGDVFQNTWTTTDNLAHDATQQYYFNQRTTLTEYHPLDDKSACKDVEVARTTAVPPVANVFQQLVNFFYG
jgi:hypothetical protein